MIEQFMDERELEECRMEGQTAGNPVAEYWMMRFENKRRECAQLIAIYGSYETHDRGGNAPVISPVAIYGSDETHDRGGYAPVISQED